MRQCGKRTGSRSSGDRFALVVWLLSVFMLRIGKADARTFNLPLYKVSSRKKHVCIKYASIMVLPIEKKGGNYETFVENTGYGHRFGVAGVSICFLYLLQ